MNSRLLDGIPASILPPAAAVTLCCATNTRYEQESGALHRKATWAQPRGQAERNSLASLGQGEIAQLVEHTTENRGVPGSSPGLAIAILSGPERVVVVRV